ncbi:MAG: hypothetical protein IIZ67_06315 [Bacilli bacterium]|nr:hypothetical protein [Bacilli bacterium]
MRCRLKVINKEDTYYNSYLGEGLFHWTYKDQARIFETVVEARKIIRKHKLKNVEIEKIRR